MKKEILRKEFYDYIKNAHKVKDLIYIRNTWFGKETRMYRLIKKERELFLQIAREDEFAVYEYKHGGTLLYNFFCIKI